MSAVIETKNLCKYFADVKAVDDVSLSIRAGTCFGLLGPNGAGKTTTVEILEGLIEPTSGEVRYKGAPRLRDFAEDAGIMFQHTALQDYMTVREALTMFASLYQQTVSSSLLIEQCALGEFLDRDTRKLSGGQKQRLLLAIALVNDPTVLFLDEPTTGLDPQARRNFWQLIKDIKQDGKTIILTTHYMEEASLLCDELAFMDHGKVIATGSPATLLKERFDDAVIQLPLHLYQDLPESGVFQSVVQGNEFIEILTNDVDACIAELLRRRIPLDQLQVRSRNLEDLFLELTGKALRA